MICIVIFSLAVDVVVLLWLFRCQHRESLSTFATGSKVDFVLYSFSVVLLSQESTTPSNVLFSNGREGVLEPRINKKKPKILNNNGGNFFYNK